jgi:hypothetical protein
MPKAKVAAQAAKKEVKNPLLLVSKENRYDPELLAKSNDLSILDSRVLFVCDTLQPRETTKTTSARRLTLEAGKLTEKTSKVVEVELEDGTKVKGRTKGEEVTFETPTLRLETYSDKNKVFMFDPNRSGFQIRFQSADDILQTGKFLTSIAPAVKMIEERKLQTDQLDR